MRGDVLAEVCNSLSNGLLNFYGLIPVSYRVQVDPASYLHDQCPGIDNAFGNPPLHSAKHRLPVHEKRMSTAGMALKMMRVGTFHDD